MAPPAQGFLKGLIGPAHFLALGALIVVTFGAAAAQPLLSSAALLPGDRAAATAAGRQDSPEIAKGSSGYLAVWADNRTSLRNVGVSGPYFGQGLGSMTDIYAARLDSSGALLDTTPIIVAQAPYNQTRPRVAWNGQSWLVVWMSERDQYYYDVLAARVAADGTLLDQSPIKLNSGTTSTNDTTPWSVASDGSSWAVTWRGLDEAAGVFTIDGARVAADGSVLDPGGKRLRQDSWNSAPVNADLAFAGDEYLMTWTETSLSDATAQVVRGLRLTPALDPIGVPFTLNQYSPSAPSAPRVASDGTSFLVVWSEERYYGFSRVYGTRVSHTGQVLNPAGLQIVGDSGYTLFTPDVVWDGANYIVAYNRQVNFGDEDIYATRVSASGAILDVSGIAVKSGAGGQFSPSAAPGAAGGARIVWAETQATTDGDIAAATLTAAGTPGPSASLSLGAPRQARPRAAASGSGYLLVAQSEMSGQARIIAQRLDAAGNALDAEPLVLATGPALANPAVAWNGSAYLVVWEGPGASRSQVYGRRVLADGAVLDSPQLTLMPGSTPDVAALGSTFLVVATDIPNSPEVRATYGVRVDAGGAVLGPPVLIGGGFDLWPRVAALGDRWLAVWEQNVTHDNPASRIAGTFVGVDGTPSARFTISDGRYDDTPHLAAAGSSALIVWADGDIFGRRILADGTLLDTAAGIVISGAANTQFTPAVAWDGAQYQVVYQDQRHEGYPTQARGDIYATGVDLNGAVLDPNGYAIANGPLPDETPFVAAANGTALFSHAAFADQSPLASFRIAVSTSGAATAEPAPSAPGALTASAASSGRVNLSWTDTSSNEVGFKIERTTGLSGSYAQIAVLGANSTSYGDITVGGSTSYVYRVRAYNRAGDSAYSAEASAMTPNSAPAVSISSPASGATFTTPVNITLSANAGDSDGTISQVEFYAGTTLIGTASASPYSVVWNNVATGSYTLTARATDSGGATAISAPVTITVSAPQPPAAPTNLSASSAVKGQVSLSWTDNATNETGFRVERSTSASTGFVQIATVGANTTSYTDSGLASRQTFYYRVRAANNTGSSSFSNTASVRVK